MTTEEMNRVIAEYLGADTMFSPTVYMDSVSPLRDKIHNRLKSDGLEFHKSWDWLLAAWQKLRGELNCLPISYFLEKDFSERLKTLILSIEVAIAQDTNITTAHRLMVEAIELIKK